MDHVVLTRLPLDVYPATLSQLRQPDKIPRRLLTRDLSLPWLQGQGETFFSWSGVFRLHVVFKKPLKKVYATKEVVHVQPVVLTHQLCG